MTVSAINFPRHANPVNNVTEAKQETKATESKNISKTALGFGLVGLAALASLGLYIATKGKARKQIVKPEISQKSEEVVENVKQKMEKIIESFNEGQYKNAPKSVKQLKNGKTTITLGDGSNRTVYIYDKNANPERRINFVKNAYTVDVPTNTGVWKIDKSKSHDVLTGETIIEKFPKEEPKFGTVKPIETTTISREQNNGVTEFKRHKYIKNSGGPFDEEVVSIETIKLDNNTIRKVRKSSLKPNESPEWNVETYVLKNNERIDKPIKDVLTADQLKKWIAAKGL